MNLSKQIFTNRRYLTKSGEFRNPQKEKLYFREEIERALIYIRPLILILGTIFLLFIIADTTLIKNPHNLLLIFADRLLMFLFVVLLFFRLPQLVKRNYYVIWITIYEVLFSASFLLIYSLYESPNLLIQSWGVILIILAIFLLPNRWIYAVSVSLLLYVGFFILALRIHPVIVLREITAAGTYPLVIIFFSSFVTSRFNYYKRIQYLYSKRLSYYSTHDTLTHLFNRYKFEDELDKLIGLAKRYQTQFSLIFYDFDDFKKINDQYGHPMGDYILRTQARIVNKNIRECDIFARWGGEEFIIILPQNNLEGALGAATKIKTIISEYPFKIGTITCSVGVTSYHEADTKDTIMQRVDQMLYMAKRGGKDGIASDLDFRI